MAIRCLLTIHQLSPLTINHSSECSMDNDLLSIQEARDLTVAAREAQRQFMRATQAEVDRICAAMAEAAYGAAERLGRLACEETGYGVPEHKTLKNVLSSKILWDAIKEIPTVGVIRHDARRRLYDIAWPMGVVAALTPSTNPTSTVIFKVLIAVKARNGIVVAPHPAAVKCCVETARIMAEAGERAGMPKGLVACMSKNQPARHAGADASQVHGADPGHGRQRHGQGRALGGEAGLRRGPWQRAGLCRPLGRPAQGRAVHRRLESLRSFGHLRHRAGRGGRPAHRRPARSVDEGRGRLLCGRRTRPRPWLVCSSRPDR